MKFDFTTAVFKKELVRFGPEEEYIVRGGRNLFPLLPKAFEGVKRIGVLGWGSQAPAQALHRKESLEGTGIRVAVGRRGNSASWKKAEEAGFSASAGTLGEMMRVASESDLVLLLISDYAQAELYPEIFRRMRKGATLGLSHGFLLGYLKAKGERFPEGINVIGVCPKGMGPSVRRLYEQGKEVNGAGINTSFAVEQDIDGRATDYALAWSIGIGAPFTFMTSLEMEYRSDIFGERGILLGAVHGMVEALYRRFMAQGAPGKEAYVRSVETVTGPVSAKISRHGIKAVYEDMPPADKRVFERVYCAAYTPMLDILSEIYDEVASGNELESVIMAGARMKRFPMVCIDDTPMWKTGEIVRKERGTVPPPAIDPTTAGVYIAGMMAQIDLLLSQGHVYSEVVNESVIEAVDSLNPYMHCRGVSYMVDNCSTTARLGSRKWAPRFDYILNQAAFPRIDRNEEPDASMIARFIGHPVHEALAAAARMRPPVDIAVRG